MLFQEMNSRIDRRYDGFFASLIKEVDGQAKLDHNIKIITWNYDIQLQRSLCSFRDEQRLHSSFEVAKEYSPMDGEPSEDCQIIRLNGSNLYYFDSRLDKYDYNSIFSSLTFDPTKEVAPKIFRKIIQCFKHFYQVGQSSIYYAWDIEGNEYLRKSYNTAKDWISMADKIIIIGYSFPNFNRSIDSDLFAHADPNQLFIQDPNAPEIKSTLRSFYGREDTIPMTYTDQFYVPRDI
jgi:hypothetical protein